MREFVDQRLGESVGEIAQRAVGAQVAEVQNRHSPRIERPTRRRRAAPFAQDEPSRGDEHDGAKRNREQAPLPDEIRRPAPSDRHARDPAGARRGQRFGEFSRSLIPVCRHFLERALDHDFELVGNRVAHDFEPRHGVERVARHDRLRRRSGEGRLAGEGLVEHAGETVDVAAPVHVARARGLLGRHICRRPDREPRLGQLVAAGRTDGARNAEVGDDRMSAREHDVLGLDVAMHDVVAVRVRQRLGDFLRNLQRIVDRQLGLVVQPVA